MSKRTKARLRMLNYYISDFLGMLFPRMMLKRLSRNIYNYHNLGVGIFPQDQEKTPHGSGERYNFDRMYMMVSNYDFTGKNIVDSGCNSGWFCIQAKLLGTNHTVGIDFIHKGMEGQAIRYAKQFERVFRLGINFVNQNLESVNYLELAKKNGIEKFDAAFLLSVLHHIGEEDMKKKQDYFKGLYDAVGEVIFYEDHEFWNEMQDDRGNKLALEGEGYRFGWNKDLTWQRKIGSLESYEKKILDYYRTTWRKDILLMDTYEKIEFLGFSEKRRPMLALFKNKKNS